MAPDPKVSDEAVARLRRLSAGGWANRDLAEAFGISPQHVGRLLRGDQRSTLPSADDDALDDSVHGAVMVFLDSSECSPSDGVLAATAQTLAAKIDSCGAATAATAAQALPRLAAQLVHVIGVLREGGSHEPDELDALVARRDTRLLASEASADFPKPEQKGGTDETHLNNGDKRKPNDLP